MRKDRLIVGVACLAYALWILVSGTTGGIMAPAVAFIMLGLWAVITSRKR